MAKLSRSLLVIASFFLVAGCALDGDHQDLRDFMREVKARPAGDIEPIPTFHAYKNFRYGAVAMRSPFEPPLVLADGDMAAGKSTVDAPDESRKKEYLEGFNFASLSMVGVLSKNGQMWALIDDGSGGIHRVSVGNYLGKNFGRIKTLTEAKVEVVEVVPDGKGSWVERPRTLALREKD
ncbi:MAG: pilus assembly protein PilP [Deltaproteobacteria bacterium]|nr:MAG: pilus assembly protein PilP [Deltaproteobacteria bacterium]